MKKKISVILIMSAAMVFGSTACFASITPPQGPGQIGFSSVVLCDSLSLHSDPGFDSPATQTLHYGDRIIVMDTADGWAHVVLGDSEDSPSGYVNEDFIVIDPAWYRTEGDTVVYAWNDTSAPKVALLNEGTTLPILRDDGDWIIVSLRGATGWINNPIRGTYTPQNNTYQGSENGSGDESSLGGVITVYDEFGDAFTLYEGTDGYWRDRSGTAYDRLSDTEFQVHEGTKRLSVYYPSQDYDNEDYEEGSGSVIVYDEYGEAYTLYEGTDGIWRDRSGTEYVQVSDSQFQVKEGTKRLSM